MVWLCGPDLSGEQPLRQAVAAARDQAAALRKVMLPLTVVNCTGIFRQVRTGDRLRLDGAGPG